MLYAVIYFSNSFTLTLTHTCSQLDDSQKRFNGEANNRKPTTVNFQTSSVQSNNKEEEKKEEQVAPPTQTSSSVTPVSRVAPQFKAMSPVNSTQQVHLGSCIFGENWFSLTIKKKPYF